MAYAESRLWLDATHHETSGWIRLVPWSAGRNPMLGARLLGVSPQEVERNPVLGLQAAAALLADGHARLRLCLEPTDACWRPALEAFNSAGDSHSNALYASQVLSLAREGLRTRDGYGRQVNVPPWGGVATNPAPRQPEPALATKNVAFAPFLAAAPTTHRPPTQAPRRIRYIVIHTTEGSFSSILDFLRHPGPPVGAHYLIRAHDGLTVQLVDENAVAFHDACFNEESIGIEHEGFTRAGGLWYSDALYQASARLVRDIAQRHGIPLDRQHILGHGEAPDCSNHTDPGPEWDWERYMRVLHQPSR